MREVGVLGNFRTASGTFTDGDLRLNQRGLRLISEETQSSRVSMNSRLFSLLIQVELVQDTSGCISSGEEIWFLYEFIKDSKRKRIVGLVIT